MIGGVDGPVGAVAGGLQIAEALIGKGDALVGLGRCEEAYLCYERVIEQFGDADTQDLRRQVNFALTKKGTVLLDLDRLDEADAAFGALSMRIRRAPDPERALARVSVMIARLFDRRAAMLYEAGRYEEAIRAADAFLERFAENPPPGRPDLVVAALRLKADALTDSGRTQEALALLGELVERYGDVEERSVRKIVARAWNKRAGLREKVAYALARNAWMLLDDRRNDEAITVVDELLARFGQASEIELCVHVASALDDKAVALGRLERWQDAIEVDEEIIHRFVDATDERLIEAVARALRNKAVFLRKLGQYDQAMVLFGEVAQRYGAATSPGLRKVVESALGARAELLGVTGQPAEAIILSDALIERAGDQTDPRERIRLADALGAKGTALIGEERYEEAIEVLNDLIERFEDDPESALRRQVTIALTNKVAALENLGREEESEGVFQDMLTRFGEEALTMFDGTTSHFANASEPQEREGLALALYGKALALSKLGRQDEALPVLTELITHLQDDENPNVQDVVSEAREAREEMVDGESE
jgi:tetratricopeptide (TPR) repeat protein